MDLLATLPPNLAQYLVIPLLIMLARICDVTIGTFRIILVSRGERLYASLAGFVEVFIWVIVVSQVLTNLGGWINYIAFAAGFAMGNYIGITLERRLAMGMVIMRVITNKPADELIDDLKQEYSFGVLHIIRYTQAK